MLETYWVLFHTALVYFNVYNKPFAMEIYRASALEGLKAKSCFLNDINRVKCFICWSMKFNLNVWTVYFQCLCCTFAHSTSILVVLFQSKWLSGNQTWGFISVQVGQHSHGRGHSFWPSWCRNNPEGLSQHLQPQGEHRRQRKRDRREEPGRPAVEMMCLRYTFKKKT